MNLIFVRSIEYLIVIFNLILLHFLVDSAENQVVIYPNDAEHCQKYNAANNFVIKFARERLQKTTLNFFYDDSIKALDECEFKETINHNFGNTLTHTILINSIEFAGNSNGKPKTSKASGIPADIRQRSRWESVNFFILTHQKLDFIPVHQHIRELDYNFIVQINETHTTTDNLENQSIMSVYPFNKFKFKVEIHLLNSTLRLTTICFYCNNGNPQVQTIFEARDTEYDIPEVLEIFPDFTKNFHGRPLNTVAGKGIQILNRFQKDETGKLISRGGFQMNILESLEKKLNFRINISESSFGSKQEDTGLYNRMIGEVQAGRAELGVAAAITSDRREAVFFLSANTFQFITFVTTKPKTKTKWQAIFRSFAPSSWGLIGFTCFCLFPVYVMCYILFYGFSNGQTREKQENQYKKYSMLEAIGQGFGFIVRPLLEQPFSATQMFKSRGAVILLLCWMFSAIIFGTAYKSILMSNMVSPLYEDSPDTYAELAAAKDYKIYLHFVGGTLPKLFNESRNPVFQKLSKRLILEKSIFKCIEKTLESKAACLSYRDNIAAESNRNFSDRNGNLLVKKSTDTAFNLPVGMLLPKNAVYKEAMDSIIRQQVDMGITEHQLNQELNLALEDGKAWAKVRMDAISENHRNGPITLSMEHFLSSFALLGVGISLGFLVFIIEHIMSI